MTNSQKTAGSYAANARVDVDYTGKEPKVSFDYPDTGKSPEKQAISQNLFGIHTFLLMIALFLIAVGIWSFTHPHQFDLPIHCIYLDSAGIYNDKISCDYGTYYKLTDINIFYDPIYGTKFYISNITDEKDRYPFIILLITFPFLFFSLNYVMTKTLLKTKHYQESIPVRAAKRGRDKYIKFTPESFEEGVPMLIIPFFRNVKLEYTADGEFSSFLKRVKIREYETQKLDKHGKLGKVRRDVFSWSAKFIFSEIPMSGSLEVKYK